MDNAVHDGMRDDLVRRAAVHAALGEPARLGIVEVLATSDRSPKELAQRFGLATNLLAHHLDVLGAVGLIERVVSAGDRRRRYVRLVRPDLPVVDHADHVDGPVLFVCSHNSARSQLAAALWIAMTGMPALSAGTHPASRVHPEAVAAGARAGLDLTAATPSIFDADTAGHVAQVVTVCDQAHEELDPDASWWHWSTPDPVEQGTAAAFDAVVADLRRRIRPHRRAVPGVV